LEEVFSVEFKFKNNMFILNWNTAYKYEHDS